MKKNFSKNLVKISQENFCSVQSLLLKAKYQLIEIWTPDEGEEIQVWKNSILNHSLSISINSNRGDAEVGQEIVSEIIDLWYELRAIRDLFEEYYTIPELENKQENETPFKRYQNKYDEFKASWEDNDNYMSKLFKKNIDPSILAFLDLDEADKKQLTN